MSDNRPQTTGKVIDLKVKTFRDLVVYQKSQELVVAVYGIHKKFPKDDFALRPQMQRAAISVPANIAEGQERFSDKESIRFLRISRGSLAELEVFLDISKKLSYVTEDEHGKINSLITEVRKLINGLIGYLNKQLLNNQS